MPSGHTDRGTINKRQPLTQGMVELLRSLQMRAEGVGVSRSNLFGGEMTQAEKNSARGLRERGLIGWDDGLAAYYINKDGEAMLAAAPPRYFVQSTRVRGEPRVYWVVDRAKSNVWRRSIIASFGTRKRAAEKRCDELNGNG